MKKVGKQQQGKRQKGVGYMKYTVITDYTNGKAHTGHSPPLGMG